MHVTKFPSIFLSSSFTTLQFARAHNSIMSLSSKKYILKKDREQKGAKFTASYVEKQEEIH